MVATLNTRARSLVGLERSCILQGCSLQLRWAPDASFVAYTKTHADETVSESKEKRAVWGMVAVVAVAVVAVGLHLLI